jgi:arylsulfatase A-like enzyme
MGPDSLPDGGDRPRPNVVFVHAHDLGRHLGCYGRGVATPNVDSLAAEGTRFENYFATAPQCCPSRGSTMTGRYPHVNGLMGQVPSGWELPGDETTLPEYLRDEGYSTHLFGMQHVRLDASTLYERVHTEHARALDVAERFEATVGDLASGGEPFFASLGYSEPHLTRDDDSGDAPWTYRYPDVPDEAFADYHPENVDPLPYLPDRRAIREQLADLDGLISATVDRSVGRVMDAIEAAGIAEETLVVFTTDHGIAFPRAKGSCYDPGVEAALVVRYPGIFDGGETYAELLSNVDLLPTLLETVGRDPPERVDGRSFLPLVSGRDYAPRDHVHVEMTWHERYAPMRGIRTARYKYVQNFWKQQRVHLPADLFGSKAGREVREEFYLEERPKEELYDLDADPHEQENLASDRGVFDPMDVGSDPDPEHADALATLRERLHGWMRETDDPLLSGPLPYPTTGADEPPLGH